MGPGCTPEGRVVGGGGVPNHRHPSLGQEEPPTPPGQPPATPAARYVRKGMRAKGPVPGPHARILHPQPVGSGPQLPA